MKDKIYIPPENDKFEDIFKLKCQMQIKLNEQKGPKPPIKNSIDNKCCFCGVENNGRNFSNRAHIIPASFGNKTYFSKDECNNCNKKFGQEYESELSEYFLIQRLLDNINKRDNKPPVFKPNTFGSSSIEMLSPNKLFLKNGEDQLLKSLFDSINSDIKSSKLPIIKKYYPVKVVKSLVHSMWLLLDNKTRKQNETLLKWFLGEFDIFPLFFSYGRSNELDRNFLNFTIWQKYKLNNNYADFVIQFVFAKNIIIFELPCFKLKKYKPSPKTTVQLNTLKETLNIEMLRIKISSNDQLEDNSNIEIGDSSSSTISILDMKGETNTELIKKEILQCEEINNLKQYILEINNYFKVCIPYCIKIDEINKNHIYNLVLCAKNNGIYIFQELESLKQKMNETYREFEKFLDQKKPPVISFKENKVFSYGSGLINYSIKIKITKPKYKKATRKEIDYITFFGDKILKSIEV